MPRLVTNIDRKYGQVTVSTGHLERLRRIAKAERRSMAAVVGLMIEQREREHKAAGTLPAEESRQPDLFDGSSA